MEDGRKKMTERIKSVRDLVVYRKAFDVAMEIFEMSKTFPREELYSLTDQIRRSSRSVCSNISEAWRKRRYRAVFVNKLSDSGQEAAETQTWLEFSLACNYMDKRVYEKLFNQYEEVFAMLHAMTEKADRFCSAK
jgi:four helix bundle protein